MRQNDSKLSALKRLERTNANLDEIDYLAKHCGGIRQVHDYGVWPF